jgi:Ca-activated chloride channel family protein
LFKGEMLIAFGRYSGKGAAAVKITGTINGDKQSFVTDVRFTDQDMSNGYIPRLWATRRVGYLLDQIRMHGESKELKDEVTQLAREHGIVTPYTAFLIVEDEKSRNVPLSLQSMRELGDDERVIRRSGDKLRQAASEAASAQARTGGGAVDAARDVAGLKDSTNLDPSAQQGQGPGQGQQNDLNKSIARGGQPTFGPLPNRAAKQGEPLAQFGTPQAPATQPSYGYKETQNYAQQARVINGRAFYQNGPTWTDSTAQNQKDLKQKKIAFNSDEYFDLLQKHPEAAQWFALGNELDIVLDGTLYMVREESK